MTKAPDWTTFARQVERIADAAWPLAEDLPQLSLVDAESRQTGLERLDDAMPALHRVQLELRRLAQATVTDGPRCQRCGGALPPSSPLRRYCSRNCRQQSYEERKAAAVAR